MNATGLHDIFCLCKCYFKMISGTGVDQGSENYGLKAKSGSTLVSLLVALAKPYV